jgi:hypothetical protein
VLLSCWGSVVCLVLLGVRIRAEFEVRTRVRRFSVRALVFKVLVLILVLVVFGVVLCFVLCLVLSCVLCVVLCWLVLCFLFLDVLSYCLVVCFVVSSCLMYCLECDRFDLSLDGPVLPCIELCCSCPCYLCLCLVLCLFFLPFAFFLAQSESFLSCPVVTT